MFFADDTSFFSVIWDKDFLARKLNNWAFQSKTSFNPDPNMQSHPSLEFNNSTVNLQQSRRKSF